MQKKTQHIITVIVIIIIISLFIHVINIWSK